MSLGIRLDADMQSQDSMEKKLLGIEDSRSNKGIFSRGKNVYKGGTGAANNQIGLKNAAKRRMMENKNPRTLR